MTSPSYPTTRPIRTVVVYRVCQHWRAPMFARLNGSPEIDLTVIHGRGIKGTKLVNAETVEGFQRHEMFTLSGRVKASGRSSPWVFHPFVWWTLMWRNPDVIVVEGGSNVLTNVLVYLYATVFRKPVIWWTLGELPNRKFSGLGKVYRRLVVWLERASTAVLGYSSVALAYFDRMGYPRERQFRAVNCVDTDRVQADMAARAAQVAELRERLALGDERVILFVGALTAPKNIHRLLHAFAAARAQLPAARLLIVGDGPDRGRLEGLTGELGLRDATIFAGEVIDGVSDYYELADVFVLPGLGGLAVSEALTHGVPVICSQGDGCEVDLVEDGVTGYRVGDGEDEQVTERLAARLVDVLSNDEPLEQLRRASREKILNEHNVHTYIDNIVAAIRYAHTGERTTPLHERADLCGED